MTRYRRAGSRWRLQVHKMRPKGWNGTTIDVESHDEIHGKYAVDIVLSDTEFDELVVGRWCHIEQMDVGFWWMSIGGVVLHVKADRDGNPKKVTVHTAGTWDDPVDGCEYEVDEEPVEMHEWSCPSCGSVTRARLADHPGEAS